jgi:hypothetical protein
VTAGFARTDEGAAVVARAARHFAHKVLVESDGTATFVHTRFGIAILEPAPGGVAIELRSQTDPELERLRAVIASHLQRFARAPLALEWRADGR